MEPITLSRRSHPRRTCRWRRPDTSSASHYDDVICPTVTKVQWRKNIFWSLCTAPFWNVKDRPFWQSNVLFVHVLCFWIFTHLTFGKHFCEYLPEMFKNPVRSYSKVRHTCVSYCFVYLNIFLNRFFLSFLACRASTCRKSVDGCSYWWGSPADKSSLWWRASLKCRHTVVL